jgi:hypothetical protein
MFAVGFALGAIRIWLITPRFGTTIAVLAEAPVILLVSWGVCLKCITHFRVSASVTARALMGFVALATLLTQEVGLSALAFGLSPVEYMVSLRSLPGSIGLSAQIAFASFPLLQARCRICPRR